MPKKQTHRKPSPPSKATVVAVRTNYKGSFDIKPMRGTDWLGLKREFMQHPTYMKPRSFLREIHSWPENRVKSGYVVRNIEGWGKEKVALRQQLLDDSLDLLRRTESERLPEVLKAKLNIIASYIEASGNIDKLGRLSIRDRSFLLQAFKTELGEPTTVGQHHVEVRPASPEVPADVAERLARNAIEA